MNASQKPKIDFKVLGAAIKKVLEYKPKKKPKASTSEKKGA